MSHAVIALRPDRIEQIEWLGTSVSNFSPVLNLFQLCQQLQEQGQPVRALQRVRQVPQVPSLGHGCLRVVADREAGQRYPAARGYFGHCHHHW